MFTDLYLSIFLLAASTFFLGVGVASWYWQREEAKHVQDEELPTDPDQERLPFKT
jgi:hypothetical protein